MGSKMESGKSVEFIASGIVHNHPCILMDFLLSTDGVNDPVITVYNGTDDGGEVVIPTCTYDASANGLNGCMGLRKFCENGLYIKIACAGTVKAVVTYHSLYGFPNGI